MDRYKILERIKRGGNGEIYRCLDLQTGEVVIEKLIRYESKDEGVPCSVLREISMLKELNHDNVVRLLNVWDDKDGFHLIFELLDLDLFSFIYGPLKIELEPHVIKSFLFQILQGVSYCHSQKVLHRDLKPQNLLVDIKSKTVKIADFGLTRTFDVPLPLYTTEVATLPYKAPELLLGTPYSTAVDIWSVGCIFAEMVEKHVLFEGAFGTAMMSHITSVVGLPDEEDWPGVTSACLKLYGIEIPSCPPPFGLAMIVPGLDAQGLDLLTKMLCVNPNRRITAYDALQHPYFNDLHGPVSGSQGTIRSENGNADFKNGRSILSDKENDEPKNADSASCVNRRSKIKKVKVRMVDYRSCGKTFLVIISAVIFLLCSDEVQAKSRVPISDAEIRQKKNDCYEDIESGLWGQQCKSSTIAKENCALRCLSPVCYELIYESDPLEEGEKDFSRSSEYKYCMHRVSLGESLDGLRGSFDV